MFSFNSYPTQDKWDGTVPFCPVPGFLTGKKRNNRDGTAVPLSHVFDGKTRDKLDGTAILLSHVF